jgi:hypothetical protein
MKVKLPARLRLNFSHPMELWEIKEDQMELDQKENFESQMEVFDLNVVGIWEPFW